MKRAWEVREALMNEAWRNWKNERAEMERKIVR